MIWRSRKFWLAVSDVAISTIVYFVGKYLGPPVSEDILFLIGAWQPVIGILIASIAYEDAARATAQAATDVADIARSDTPL